MEIITKFMSWILGLLPTSPFAPYIDQIKSLPYLGYVNYVLPIGDFVKIGIAWTGAIAFFYIASIVLRWIRAIK